MFCSLQDNRTLNVNYPTWRGVSVDRCSRLHVVYSGAGVAQLYEMLLNCARQMKGCMNYNSVNPGKMKCKKNSEE